MWPFPTLSGKPEVFNTLLKFSRTGVPHSVFGRCWGHCLALQRPWVLAWPAPGRIWESLDTNSGLPALGVCLSSTPLDLRLLWQAWFSSSSSSKTTSDFCLGCMHSCATAWTCEFLRGKSHGNVHLNQSCSFLSRGSVSGFCLLWIALQCFKTVFFLKIFYPVVMIQQEGYLIQVLHITRSQKTTMITFDSKGLG